MSLAYLILVSVMKTTTHVAWRRANRSEAKWAAASERADAAAEAHVELGKKTTKPAAVAASYYRVGRAEDARDAQQALAQRKADRAERLEKATAAVSAWKGKGIPYSAGVIDTALGVTLGQVFQPWVVERLLPVLTAWVERLREMVG